MYIRLFVILMVCLCILGIVTGSFLYFGFDPSYHPTLSLILMGISCIMTFGSLLGLIFLLIKKIALRGYLYPLAAFRAFRHGLLITTGLVAGYIFSRYDLLSLSTGFLLLCILFIVEIILTKIEDA